MDHPCYNSLSHTATRLLFEFARQYNGHNNGDLCAAWKLMHVRGWRSRDTLDRAKRELLDHGLILLTRQGGRRKANLYALTWRAIDECKGKLDIGPTRVPPGDWQKWTPSGLNSISDARQTCQSDTATMSYVAQEAPH
jgi:hypothetical protein